MMMQDHKVVVLLVKCHISIMMHHMMGGGNVGLQVVTALGICPLSREKVHHGLEIHTWMDLGHIVFSISGWNEGNSIYLVALLLMGW